MKKILGSLFILCLSLFGKSPYEWKVELSQNELYLYQSAVLKMQCRFGEEGKNNDVEFSPPKDVPFDFELLSENRDMEEGGQRITYKYLIFAKEAGEHELRLKPRMLFMTQSAINNIIIGRDNVNDLEAEKEIAEIPPLKIKVKETASRLTGELSLKTRVDRRELSAYEPAHLEIVIEGEGNLQELKPVLFDIEEVEVFSDSPESELVLSEKGYRGKWIQRFAFVAKESFTIPSVSVPYFDLGTQEEKLLKSKGFDITVKAECIKKEELIDKIDLPSEKIDLGEYLEYVYYLLTFISGFVAAKLFKLPQRSPKKEKGDKIKQARSDKELLEVLIRCEKKLFSSEIELLEGSVYKGNEIALSKLKKSALSKL